MFLSLILFALVWTNRPVGNARSFVWCFGIYFNGNLMMICKEIEWKFINWISSLKKIFKLISKRCNFFGKIVNCCFIALNIKFALSNEFSYSLLISWVALMLPIMCLCTFRSTHHHCKIKKKKIRIHVAAINLSMYCEHEHETYYIWNEMINHWIDLMWLFSFEEMSQHRWQLRELRSEGENL